jgi:hypothetical protein
MPTRETVATALPFDGRIVETSDGLWTASVTGVSEPSPDAFRVDLEFKRGPHTERGALLLATRRLSQTASDDELAWLLRHAFKTRQTPPTEAL